MRSFGLRKFLFVACIVMVCTLVAAANTGRRAAAHCTSRIRSARRTEGAKPTAKSRSARYVSGRQSVHARTGRSNATTLVASRHDRHAARSSAASRRPAVAAASVVHHGQQGIDSERAMQIQQALIREKYLDGEPSGIWDQRTKDAMMRLQNDNGWQTKVVPDSRALIKLGLGPSHDHLLNPEALAHPMVLSDHPSDLSPEETARQR